MTRYRWVAARKAEGFPITMACTVAEVSRQAFGDWRTRTAAGPTASEREEAELVAVMREIHAESDGTYGEPRMTDRTRASGSGGEPQAGPATDAPPWHRRCVQAGEGAHHDPRRGAPAGAGSHRPAFRARSAGCRLGAVTSPTWRPVKAGCTSASVLDLGSRRLVGYSMAEHMRTELVADALEMAAADRGGQTAGIIFHCDRGSQYLSSEYRELLADLDMVQSVGRTGVCWDNAVAESFWSSLKRELVHRYRFPTAPPHAGRSSPGSTATTTTDSTRVSATCHPSSGNSNTVNSRPTRPRNPRDRSTGGS